MASRSSSMSARNTSSATDALVSSSQAVRSPRTATPARPAPCLTFATPSSPSVSLRSASLRKDASVGSPTSPGMMENPSVASSTTPVASVQRALRGRAVGYERQNA